MVFISVAFQQATSNRELQLSEYLFNKIVNAACSHAEFEITFQK